ncbi:uncharacterized protein LOC136065342 [Quercus suber]|uniref:uncharacterized protein LOC136065342 n=1 Tax=Quercus suber TaxID=58331 RepID=UPI0032DED43A
MVDQGIAVEITYPDLFKGLNLRLDDLTPYCSPLVSFKGGMVTPKGQIRLPVQTGSKVVEVNFIVVDVYSPYTRMMTKMFESQLGKSIEVYIDDMVVKSEVISEHVKDLDNVFETLRRHKLRLNASKCLFGVGSDKFLGYMVTHRGIEVNPDQIKAIQNLQPPRNPKEVQKLTRMVAALNRFISKSPDKCKPFFSLINKWKGLNGLKNVSQLSNNSKTTWLGHQLCLALNQMRSYLPISQWSPMLYLPLEKAILAVVLRTRKLPHYFQAPIVVVLTQLPLKTVLRSADYTGRIAKWGIILGAFDIKYMPHTSVKGQILANLVVEFTEPSLEEVTTKRDMDGKSVGMISQQDPARWEVYVDGAANWKGSGVGLVLTSPEGIIIKKSLRLDFGATNNEAEYEALLIGMSMVRRMGGKAVELFSDSRLVVGQVQGEFEAKDERMQGYLNRIKHLQAKFEFFSLLHVSRSSNMHADSLATLATSSEQDLPRVILVENFHEPIGTGGDAVRVHQI